MAVDPKYQKEMNEQIAKQPKLSALDRGIWLGGAVVCFLASAWLYFLLFAQMGMLRELEPEAVAVQETMAVLWGLPAGLFLFIIGLACLIYPFQRCALFGKKGAVYEGSTHREVLGYPLFMDLSGAPEAVSRRVWRERKVWINVGIALAVCLYLFTWSGNGRNVLDPDGGVRVYSGRGTLKAAYAPEQAERFALRISEPYSGRHGSQEYHELDFMIRFTDGRYFVFQMKERTGDDLRYLRQLLALKERFGPEIVRVEDAELLEDLILDQDWTGEAETLARALFGG